MTADRQGIGARVPRKEDELTEPKTSCGDVFGFGRQNSLFLRQNSLLRRNNSLFCYAGNSAKSL